MGAHLWDHILFLLDLLVHLGRRLAQKPSNLYCYRLNLRAQIGNSFTTVAGMKTVLVLSGHDMFPQEIRFSGPRLLMMGTDGERWVLRVNDSH